MQEIQIFGPPGTGKTTELARRIEGAYEQFGESITAASFTRTAAFELVRRDLPIPRDHIGTLHSLCFHALGRPEIADTPRYIKQWNEDHPEYHISGGGGNALDETAADATMGGDHGDMLLADMNRQRALMRPRELWPPLTRGFADAWEGFKREGDLFDFTDLIDYSLSNSMYAPGAPQVGFFDEAQDFSRLSLALIRKWAKAMEYCVIAGDDDQTLYSFIGATPDAFLDSDPATTKKRVLAQSYRVPRAIHGLAMKIVGKLSARQEKEYQPRPEDGIVRRLSASVKNPAALVADAEEKVKAGKSVMILASASYLLNEIIVELRDRGIPFGNRWRRSRGDWNPLARRGGTSAVERVLSYLVTDPDYANTNLQSMWTREQVRLWSDLVPAAGVFKHGAKASLAKVAAGGGPVDELFPENNEPEIGDDPEEVRPLTFDEAVSLFADAAMDHPEWMKLAWLDENLMAKRKPGVGYILRCIRARGVPAILAEPRLTVGTVHSVKGGEADVVYLATDLSPAAMREYTGRPTQRDTILRMLYVGVTRAREELVLLDPSTPCAIRIGG